MSLRGWRAVRRLALLALQRVNPGDVRIRHHWVSERRVRLHSFRHRNYWYQGRQREAAVMRSLARLVRPGERVVELGGHIGYLTLYFLDLVGEHGQVVVFEPGTNNLPYLRRNCAGIPNCEIVPMAVSDRNGPVELVLEALSGQNNSLLTGYAQLGKVQDGLAVDLERVTVPSVTLDSFLAERGLVPDFVKADIEGAELLMLRGAAQTFARARPKLLIEITENEAAVLDILQRAGYVGFNAALEPMGRSEPTTHNFFLHRVRHADLLREIGGATDSSPGPTGEARAAIGKVA